MSDPEAARRSSLLRTVVLVLSAMSAPACDPAPDAPVGPESVVRAFLERIDRHEVEGALDLLEDGFVFRSGDGSFAARRGALPDMLAWDAAAESDVEVRELAESGDTVRVRLVERNRFTELLDLEPWVVDAEFVVRDGRIVEEVAREVAVGDGAPLAERFDRALEPVRRWALEARPAEAGAVFEDGSVARYDGPTARRLLELIEAYLDGRGDER